MFLLSLPKVRIESTLGYIIGKFWKTKVREYESDPVIDN
jgi:hypothetical protein